MVDTIAIMGQHIAAGELSRRVQTDGSGDPLDRLRGSLNAMLARIEALVEELRLLTDALAHDIRSPLMRISARIERARRLPPGSDQLGSLDAISREVEGLLRMLESTLEIGRAEAGIGREQFETFEVTEVMQDLCEMYQPLAAEQRIAIVLAQEARLKVFGNRSLIARAVANLIDNAIKYAADGGHIEIGVAWRLGEVSLSVSDRGNGIPMARRSEALRKFGRLDGARLSPGSGLGLALVNAVTLLHDGRLTLDDNQPGLRATMRLKQGLVAGPAERLEHAGRTERRPYLANALSQA
jgi:signal transduction histidine kinase